MLPYRVDMTRFQLSLALMISMVFFVLPLHSTAYSLDNNEDFNNCEYTDSTLTGSIEIPPGKYKVLLKSSSTDTINLYTESEETCKTISTGISPTSEHKVVGTIEVSKKSTQYFYLTARDKDALLDRFGLSLTLIPENKSISLKNGSAFTKINGQEGSITPVRNSPLFDTLSLSVVVDPDKDRIERVDYYIDSKFYFTEPTLEEFDSHFITNPYEQLPIRIITYTSGQQITLVGHPESQKIASPIGTLRHLYNRLSGPIQFSIFTTTIIAVLMAIRFFFRKYRQRQLWKISHGLKPIANRYSGEMMARFKASRLYLAIISIWSILRRTLIITLPIITVALIVISLFLDIHKVSGPSMENSIQDGSRVIVNKSRQTLSRLLSGYKYIPERGDVVISKTDFSNLYDNGFLRPQGTMVKRVIGLPGERIIIENGEVSVYAPNSSQTINPDKSSPWSKTMHVDTEDKRRIDITLLNDEVYLMGDNRPMSIDSRTLGPIKIDQIVGIVY